MRQLLVVGLGTLALFVASCCDEDNPVTETGPLFSLTVVDDQGDPVEGLRVGSINHPKNVNPKSDAKLKPCPQTDIAFSLPEESDYILTVHDYYGRMVCTVDSGHHSAGNYIVVWNGADSLGNLLVSGFYRYQLVAGTYEQENWFVLETGPDPHQTILGALNSNGQFVTNDTLLFPGLLGNPPIDFYTDTVTIHLSDPDFPDDFFYYTTRLNKTGNSFRFTLDSLDLP